MPRYKVKLNDVQLEQVENFDYLGSLLTTVCRCEKEIKKRIILAKKAFINKRNILTNKSISTKLKKRFIKTYVWSILLYGCESWTLNKTTESILVATEMWCWRRMLRISWAKK